MNFHDLDVVFVVFYFLLHQKGIAYLWNLSCCFSNKLQK